LVFGAWSLVFEATTLDSAAKDQRQKNVFMKWRSLDETNPGTDTRSLHDQFAECKQLIAQYVPAETQAIHARVISELKEGGLEGRILGVGADAPAFELHAHDEQLISSAKLLANGKLVICFFRGRWCPFCVGQLEAMNRILPEIQAMGASLVAISPQNVKHSSFMADQHKLRFPLLSDAGNQVARQFGLVYRVPENQQAIYRRAFVNLPLANGDQSWELPIPATFIIDSGGSVLCATGNADYTTRPEPADILEKLAGG
jgi:peroxiredoxin